MNFKEFSQSLSSTTPPQGLSKPLEALWYDAKGNWDHAHDLVKDSWDESAFWVHAFLHREEGDYGNSSYWYRRSNKSQPSIPLQEEWEQIVKGLL
ncbi:MAG: hypothetical protein EHM72_11920, partial [Calditrichaeota bacterium]